MSAPEITRELYGDLVETASRPDFAEWLSMVKGTGGCAQPIHLWGQATTIHTGTGEVLAQRPPGRLLVACGNRRARRCSPCSETYRADTYQLIRAGLVGGKTVPDTVTTHPKVFATFTAPSFGPVHHRTVDETGRPHRCHPHGPHRCGQRHPAGDPQLGQPLDPATYDYIGAVVWNALATRLWARTVQLVNRHAARLLGIPQRAWLATGRVSVAKVAEYQARGVVHFHAVFRIDGPEPDISPPAAASAELLCDAIRRAAEVAHVRPPNCQALDGVGPAGWGEQLDVRPITTEHEDSGGLSDEQVAGYVAKYATKGADAAGTVDRSVACRTCQGAGVTDHEAPGPCADCNGSGLREPLDTLTVSPHARAMINTCWWLGGLPELQHLRLRPWAHMLGFRGHFSTKSRRYSITLSALREARQDWHDERTRRAHGLDGGTRFRRVTVAELEHPSHALDEFDPGEDSVLVVGHWTYTGRGHTQGEAVFAATVAADQAENRRLARQLEPRRTA